MNLTKAGIVTGALLLTATTLTAATPAMAESDGAKDIVGTSGDDTIRGTTKSDYIRARGGGGKDTIYGGKHGDHLVGGNAADSFYARGGADTVYPGRGRDVVRLAKANDTSLIFELDNRVDVFYCGPGNDTVVYYYDQIDSRDQHHGCESVEYAVD